MVNNNNNVSLNTPNNSSNAKSIEDANSNNLPLATISANKPVNGRFGKLMSSDSDEITLVSEENTEKSTSSEGEKSSIFSMQTETKSSSPKGLSSQTSKKLGSGKEASSSAMPKSIFCLSKENNTEDVENSGDTFSLKNMPAHGAKNTEFAPPRKHTSKETNLIASREALVENSSRQRGTIPNSQEEGEGKEATPAPWFTPSQEDSLNSDMLLSRESQGQRATFNPGRETPAKNDLIQEESAPRASRKEARKEIASAPWFTPSQEDSLNSDMPLSRESQRQRASFNPDRETPVKNDLTQEESAPRTSRKEASKEVASAPWFTPSQEDSLNSDMPLSHESQRQRASFNPDRETPIKNDLIQGEPAPTSQKKSIKKESRLLSPFTVSQSDSPQLQVNLNERAISSSASSFVNSQVNNNTPLNSFSQSKIVDSSYKIQSNLKSDSVNSPLIMNSANQNSNSVQQKSTTNNFQNYDDRNPQRQESLKKDAVMPPVRGSNNIFKSEYIRNSQEESFSSNLNIQIKPQEQNQSLNNSNQVEQSNKSEQSEKAKALITEIISQIQVGIGKTAGESLTTITLSQPPMSILISEFDSAHSEFNITLVVSPELQKLLNKNMSELHKQLGEANFTVRQLNLKLDENLPPPDLSLLKEQQNNSKEQGQQQEKEDRHKQPEEKIEAKENSSKTFSKFMDDSQ